MSQIGESIAVAAVKNLSPCWYCETEATWPPRENDENAAPEASDSDDEDSAPENDEGNESSALGSSLGTPPQWTLNCPSNEEKVTIGPAAHHCIPGNASLKKATTLHRFMRKGGPLKLASDIGYNVNNASNGVWLPGNYGVRAGKAHYTKKWGSQSATFKESYATRAMDASKRQFHDAHPKYSENVLKTLRSIAAKLGKPEDKCPICDEPFTKTRPPYGLVGRLDLVSGKHRTMLTTIGKRVAKKFVQDGYFTSSRVKTYYGLV